MVSQFTDLSIYVYIYIYTKPKPNPIEPNPTVIYLTSHLERLHTRISH